MALVGFIGLGIMGKPMAANLVRHGHTVHGYTLGGLSPEDAAATGVTPVADVAAAVRDADVVITMLPDTPDVLDVALGAGGVLETVPRSATYIDMSTIDPAGAAEVHRRFAAAGVATLDAPVSGGESGAVAGALSIMVGGDEKVFAASRDLLRCMGTTVVHVGGPASGQTVKAANQLIVAGNIQVLAEALVLLRGQGVDLPTALDVLAGGLAGSTVLDRKRDAFLAADFTPGFRVELHHKDLGIVQKIARDTGVALPVTALVAQLVQALVAQGQGKLDHSALYGLAARTSGMQL